MLGLGLCFHSLGFANEEVFGNGANLEQVIDVKTVLASPSSFIGKDITVAGEIDSVCGKKGCWMMMKSGHEQLRIKVKDGDMVFPFNAKGKRAFATGKLEVIEMSEKQALAYQKHMAEDAGEDFEPKNVTKELVFYQLKPVGVTIK